MPWLTHPAPFTPAEWATLPLPELLENLPPLPEYRYRSTANVPGQYLYPSQEWRVTPYRFLLVDLMRAWPLPDMGADARVRFCEMLESVRPGTRMDWEGYRARWQAPNPTFVNLFHRWISDALFSRLLPVPAGEPPLMSYVDRASDMIRECFGYPWRSDFPRAWQTPTAVSLAAEIWETRDWGQLPVLADAVEDAGCTRKDVLDHLRGGGQHSRGCWVLSDILLPPVEH